MVMTTKNIRPYKNNTPTIASSAWIDESSVVIGDVTLSENVSIWPLVVIRGDVNRVSIGARTNIQDGSILHVTHKSASHPDGYPLVIGNDVTIGHKVILHGCQIEDRVLVGMGSIILDGALIESDVIIGAGSLVTGQKTLASGYLYMGQPARQIRPLTPEERAHLLYSANNYVTWKNDYLQV